MKIIISLQHPGSKPIERTVEVRRGLFGGYWVRSEPGQPEHYVSDKSTLALTIPFTTRLE